MDLFFDPPADELLSPYWKAFERQEIALPRCSACGRFQWYPDAAGPDCADADYEWVSVATTGTVHTLTRVHRSFLPGATTPFAVALIDLDGVDDARLVANVDDEAGIRIGDRVAARFTQAAGRWRPIFVPDPTRSTNQEADGHDPR